MPIMNQIVKGGGGAGPEYYVEKTLDANGMLINTSTLIKLDGIVDVSGHCLDSQYRGVSFPAHTIIRFKDLQTISGSYAMASMFVNATGPESVVFDSLETITGTYALSSFCSGVNTVVSLDMKNVESITGGHACESMLTNCYRFNSFNLDKLKVISGASACENMFVAYKGTTASLPSLEKVEGTNVCKGMLSASSLTSISLPVLVATYHSSSSGNQGALQNFVGGSSSLVSFNVPSLKYIGGVNDMRSALQACTSMTSLSFPAITTTSFGSVTNQFLSMCSAIPSITIHFPSNVQSQVEALTGYSTTEPFSAISGTVLFDLPATVILTGANSQAYERSPKDDTPTALAWRKQDTGTAPNFVIDWTPFYTSGTTDPAVGDTIYSDSACTTAVTTISSIA